MASTLRILPDIESKTIVCEGAVAVRESVALTVVMPSGSMEPGDDIRVRIRGPRGDVARFPLADDDAWGVAAGDGGATILTATLNCDTDELAKIFRYVPENGKLPFLVTVENETQKSLCGRGRVRIMNWAGDGNPVSVESERVSAADIRKAVENIPTDYSTQREIGSALSSAVRALKDFGLCLAAAFALGASATEWQDVPADTVIGEGLALTNGEIRATASGASGLTTNDVRAIVAAATNAIPRGIAVEGAPATNLVSSGTVYWIMDEYGASPVVDGAHVLVPFSNIENVPDFAVRTNLPPVSASATVGEMVDAINAVIRAMKKEKEDE